MLTKNPLVLIYLVITLVQILTEVISCLSVTGLHAGKIISNRRSVSILTRRLKATPPSATKLNSRCTQGFVAILDCTALVMATVRKNIKKLQSAVCVALPSCSAVNWASLLLSRRSVVTPGDVTRLICCMSTSSSLYNRSTML